MSRYQSEAPPGQPTHAPAIRIRGIETGSAKYVAMVDKYQGALRQFHNAQQQQVSTGQSRQYKVTKRVPGARMTYLNSEGQETITLEIDPIPEGEQQEKPPPDEYWKWAIVEMKIPNIQGLTTFVGSAFMTPPPTNKLGYSVVNINPYDTENPPLAYAVPSLADTIFADVQENDGYASLRVDLRPYPGGVKFDLYGYILRYADGTELGDPTTANKTMYQRAGAIGNGSGSYVTLGGSTNPFWYSSAAISARTIGNYIYKDVGTPRTTLADIAESFPAVTGPFTATGSSVPGSDGNAWLTDAFSYAGETIVWTPGSGNCPNSSTMDLSGLISAGGGAFSEVTTFMDDGVSKMVRGFGVQTYTTSGGVDTILNGAGPLDAYGNWSIAFFDCTIFYVGVHPTVTHYEYPDRDCPISFTVLDDGPDGVVNRYGSPFRMNSYTWEATSKYPDRWPMRELPDLAHMRAIADPTSGSTNATNHFDMIKLGTVIINPRKGKGGIKFIAA